MSMSNQSKSFLAQPYSLISLAMLGDIFAVFMGSGLAYALRFGFKPVEDAFLLAVLIVAILLIVLNVSTGAYTNWRTSSLASLLFSLCRNWLIVALVLVAIIYFSHESQRFSRLWLGLSLLFSFCIAALGRISGHLILAKIRARGRNRRQVFLIGSTPSLIKVARQMRKNRSEGFSIGGAARLATVPLSEEVSTLAHRIRQATVNEVWICVPLEMGATVKALMYELRNDTHEIRFLPELSDIPLLNHQVSQVAGLYSIDLSMTPMNGTARVLKRLEDLVVGGLIMLLITPICLLIAIAIKVTSPGPVLFKQYRTGINGKEFKVYKFRSMKIHQEEDGQVTQARKGDSRITPIGAFLRRTSLDELPQFFNVLQGRMSIVGPRPHALAHNEYYKDLVESYMRRHKVKPGITGWAQVNGLRGETDTLEKMQKRVEYDLWYIDNWSLWLDLKIIFLTIFKGFINKNAY